MTEQDIIRQLHNLRNIQPDSNWSARNREILHSQIFGQSANSDIEADRKLNGFVMLFNYTTDKLTAKFVQPAWVAAIIILVFTFSIGGSVYAARNAKPGDSLYIAKVISEKARLAVTFGEKEKAKLGMTFASNRAKEITQVLAQPTDDKVLQQEQVKQLEADFKKEISNVITRLEKTNTIKKTAKSDQAKKDEVVKTDKQDLVKEPEVFGANLAKDNQRMEVAVPDKSTSQQKQEENKPEAKSQVKTQPIAQSTTTKENTKQEADIQEKGEIEKVLLDAEKLLIEKKDVDGTLNKLDEAKVIINFVDPEEGKGATSTQK